MSKLTRAVKVRDLQIGGGAPISVQSMAATRTQDVEATLKQVQSLVEHGADLIRIAIDNDKDAACLKEIRQQTQARLVVDLQENYRLAETVAPFVDKIRYNPGHLHHHEKHKSIEEKVAWLVSIAKEHGNALRVGVNCGSVAPDFLERFQGDHTQAIVESAAYHCDILGALQDRLAKVGYSIENDIDALVELSARKPGQKGGAAYVMEDGSLVPNEDPAVKASFEKFERNQDAAGLTVVSSEQLLSLLKLSSIKDSKIGKIARHVEETFFQGQKTLPLQPYHMRYDEDRSIAPLQMANLIKENKLLIYEKDGEFFFYEAVTSQDSFGFNNAAATINPEILAHIYRDDDQTAEEALKELRNPKTSAARLRELSLKGLDRFPTLIDPKLNKGIPIVKPETNMWQIFVSLWDQMKEAGEEATDQIKFEALLVPSFTDVDEQFRVALAEEEEEKAFDLALTPHFMPNKKWGDPDNPKSLPETYFFNLPYIQRIVTQLEIGKVLRQRDIELIEDELGALKRFLSSLEQSEDRAASLERSLRIKELFKALIQHIRSQEWEAEPSAKGATTTALSI